MKRFGVSRTAGQFELIVYAMKRFRMTDKHVPSRLQLGIKLLKQSSLGFPVEIDDHVTAEYDIHLIFDLEILAFIEVDTPELDTTS